MNTNKIFLCILLPLFSYSFDVKYHASNLKKTNKDERFDVKAEKQFTEQYVFSYNQDKDIAWQLSFLDFGKQYYSDDDSREKKSAEMYTFGVQVPFFDVYALSTDLKVGVHAWQYTDQGENSYGEDIYYGFAWDFPLSDSFSAISSYERYKVEQNNLNKLFLGVEYKF